MILGSLVFESIWVSGCSGVLRVFGFVGGRVFMMFSENVQGFLCRWFELCFFKCFLFVAPFLHFF